MVLLTVTGSPAGYLSRSGVALMPIWSTEHSGGVEVGGVPGRAVVVVEGLVVVVARGRVVVVRLGVVVGGDVVVVSPGAGTSSAVVDVVVAASVVVVDRSGAASMGVRPSSS